MAGYENNRHAMERLCQQRAAEWLAYERSPQAKIDAEADRVRREAADRRAGQQGNQN